MSSSTALKRFITPDSFDFSSQNQYLIGYRGLLVIQSFNCIFLKVFAPTAVPHSENADGPSYQQGLRRSVGVLFWNEGLIYSAFILLSARTICIPFLQENSKGSIAGAIFRRGLRLWIPVAVSLAIVVLVFSQIGYDYLEQFMQATGNVSIEVPYEIKNALIYFNSVFNLFWITSKFGIQAGNLAYPSQTMWIINVIYTQSFTVYMAMAIVPYTRRSWRVKGAVLFIATAWWVQSWAWYSITGLILADAVINMDFKAKAARGFPIRRSMRIPSWVVYAIILGAGLTMQFLWVAWRPSYYDEELRAHGALYSSGGLNDGYDVSQPQARDDNYLVLLAFFLIMESSETVQWVLTNPLFRYLGKRSLSWFLIQSIIIYSVGVKLYATIAGKGVSTAGATAATFFVCLPTVAILAEIYYRVVEVPSHALSHLVFDWIRE